MNQEFEPYRIGEGYIRPESQYDPFRPSLLEAHGYQHPARPPFRMGDWVRVYSRLSPDDKSRVLNTGWKTDYSRLNGETQAILELLVNNFAILHPNTDIVSLLSDRFNVHRGDVVGAIDNLGMAQRVQLATNNPEISLPLGVEVQISK